MEVSQQLPYHLESPLLTPMKILLASSNHQRTQQRPQQSPEAQLTIISPRTIRRRAKQTGKDRKPGEENDAIIKQISANAIYNVRAKEEFTPKAKKAHTKFTTMLSSATPLYGTAEAFGGSQCSHQEGRRSG